MNVLLEILKDDGITTPYDCRQYTLTHRLIYATACAVRPGRLVVCNNLFLKSISSRRLTGTEEWQLWVRAFEEDVSVSVYEVRGNK